MRIEKEVIRPGTYWYDDPLTHTPRKAVLSAESVRYLYDQGKAMLAAGLSIPVPLEHQKLQAMTAAEKAAANLQNNAGWVHDFKLKTIKDEASGQEVEALFSDTDILDAKIAAKLPKTIRWTSPYISSFTDGNGKTWNGVISHLALTTRPRIIKQQPFPSLAAAMSLAEQLQDSPPPQSPGAAIPGILLSRAGLLKKIKDKLAPAFPVAFSLWSGIGLAADFPKDKKEGKKDKKDEGSKPHEGEGEGKGEPTIPEETREELEESLIDEDGDISIYAVTADLLDAIGIPMEASTAENFLQNLYNAVMAQIKGEGGTMPEPTKTAANDQGQGGKAPVIQEQPPLYMSLDHVQTIADPTLRSIALSNLKLQEQITALGKRHECLEKNALDSAKARRQARIDRLLSKLSPKAKERLAAEAQSAAFALGDDGLVKDALETTLTLLEESVPDLPDLLIKDPRLFSVQAHPKEFQGEMSEERRQQVVAEACKNGRVRTPADLVMPAKK